MAVKRKSDLKKNMKIIFSWGPAILSGILILYFSVSKNGIETLFSVQNSDKILHFLAYAFLSLFIFRGRYLSHGKLVQKSFLFALILSGGYGILLELFQGVIGYRDFSIFDIAANFAGALFASSACYIYYYARKA